MVRSDAQKRNAKSLQEQLHNGIKGHVKTLQMHHKIPKKSVATTVDLHLIPRYDKRQGQEYMIPVRVGQSILNDM